MAPPATAAAPAGNRPPAPDPESRAAICSCESRLELDGGAYGFLLVAEPRPPRLPPRLVPRCPLAASWLAALSTRRSSVSREHECLLSLRNLAAPSRDSRTRRACLIADCKSERKKLLQLYIIDVHTYIFIYIFFFFLIYTFNLSAVNIQAVV